MRRLAIAVLGAAAFGIGAVQFASAADLAVKAPPPAPPGYAWTGCSIGGNVGAGSHRIGQSETALTDGTQFVPPIDWGTSRHADVIGGGQFSCDYQFTPSWLLGMSSMFDFGNIKSSDNLPDPRVAAITPFQSTSTRDIVTVAPRLGYLFTPQLLGYAKAGGAWTRTTTTVFGTTPFLFTSEFATTDRLGWTVGGGLEWMFAPNWSVFAEYDYLDFGRENVTFNSSPPFLGAPTITATRLTMQIAAVGVNWHFLQAPGR